VIFCYFFSPASLRPRPRTKERLSFGTRYYTEVFFFSRRRTSLNGIVGSLRWLAIMPKSYRSSSNSSYSSIGKMTALRLPFLTTYSAADSRALSEQDYSCGEDAATNPAGATQGNHPNTRGDVKRFLRFRRPCWRGERFCLGFCRSRDR